MLTSRCFLAIYQLESHVFHISKPTVIFPAFPHAESTVSRRRNRSILLWTPPWSSESRRSPTVESRWPARLSETKRYQPTTWNWTYRTQGTEFFGLFFALNMAIFCLASRGRHRMPDDSHSSCSHLFCNPNGGSTTGHGTVVTICVLFLIGRPVFGSKGW